MSSVRSNGAFNAAVKADVVEDRNTRVTLKKLRKSTLDINGNAVEIHVQRDCANAYRWHSLVLTKSVRAGEVILIEAPLFAVCTAASMLGRRSWQSDFVFVGNCPPREMSAAGGCGRADCGLKVRNEELDEDPIAVDCNVDCSECSSNKKSGVSATTTGPDLRFKTPTDHAEFNQLLILEHALRSPERKRLIYDESWMHDYCFAGAGMLNHIETSNGIIDRLLTPILREHGEHKNALLRRNCHRFLGLMRGNAFESSTPLYVAPYGLAFYAVASYCNHSCTPNAWWSVDDGQTLVLRAICDLESGVEISIPYDSVWGALRGGVDYHRPNQFGGFVCACSLCVEAVHRDAELRAANLPQRSIVELVASNRLASALSEADCKRLRLTIVSMADATRNTTVSKLPFAKKMTFALLQMPGWFAMCERGANRSVLLLAVSLLHNLYDTLLLSLMTMDRTSIDDLKWLGDYSRALERSCTLLINALCLVEEESNTNVHEKKADDDDRSVCGALEDDEKTAAANDLDDGDHCCCGQCRNYKALPGPRYIGAIAHLLTEMSSMYLLLIEERRALEHADNDVVRATQLARLTQLHAERWRPERHIPSIVEALCRSVVGIGEHIARRWVDQFFDMAGFVFSGSIE